MTKYVVLFIFAFLPISTFYTQEQGKYDLTPKTVEGQKFNVSIESAIDLDISVKSQDKTGSSNSISMISRNKFAITITEAKNNKPRTMSVSCTSSTLEKRGSNVEPIGPGKTKLDGKSFILKRKGRTFEVAPKDNSTLNNDDLSSLGRWEDYRLLLPDEEVKVGDEWEVDIEDILALLSDTDENTAEGELTCKLESVSDGKATISIAGKGEAIIKTGGKGKEDKVKTKADATLNGSIVFDVENRLPLSISISGSINIQHNEFSKSFSPVGEVNINSRKFTLNIVFEW